MNKVVNFNLVAILVSTLCIYRRPLCPMIPVSRAKISHRLSSKRKLPVVILIFMRVKHGLL